MDQEVEIISSETRKEKIKNFIINKKKTIVSAVIFLLLILFSFFFYQEYKKENREFLANKYNATIIENETGNKSKVLNSMKEIIYDVKLHLANFVSAYKSCMVYIQLVRDNL